METQAPRGLPGRAALSFPQGSGSLGDETSDMTDTLMALLATILPMPMQNEVTSVRVSDIHMRDPWVMPHDGTYYLVGTTGEPWGKTGGGFAGYSSTDLIDWTPRGGVLSEPADPTWA